MLGILKIAGSAIRGIGNFIQKRKAKKEAKIDKAAAKLEARRVELSKIAGNPDNGPTFNAADILKASGMIPLDMPDKMPPVKIPDYQKGSMEESKSMPVWLWPVVGIAAIFLLPKLLKK